MESILTLPRSFASTTATLTCSSFEAFKQKVSVSFGPNAYYVEEIDYDIDNSNLDSFYKSINEYLDVKREWNTTSAVDSTR